MLFTSMALGMILSISWGVEKELAAEAADEAAAQEDREQVAAEQVAGHNLQEETVHEGDE